METLDENATGVIHRTLLCQGPVELRRGWRRKQQHLSLFSDVLVVSNNLCKRKFNIKYVIPLSFLWMGDYVDILGTDSSSADKSILLFWPMGNFVATFRSTEQKDRWYSFLQRSINEATKGYRKHFKLPIFTEDIPSCASPLYVTTTDLETVNDVIQKLLPLIGMPSAQDYQLWFCHDREKAPGLLQEHEHLYDIIMRNIKNPFSQWASRNHTAFPALPGLYVEQPDIQGRFILKPREPARIQKQNSCTNETTLYNDLISSLDTEEPRIKKQWPFISWLFQRSSVPYQNQMCTAPPVAKTGKLFGHDLTAICEDGNLPTAILDILSFISEKGPITEGIFRTSGDIRAFRALKERLDSGIEVNLNNESVPVVASILKEFLQNIEGSVLTSRLYDEWLAVLDQVCEEEKAAAVQRLLEQLPQPNVILLKQLFGILYKIERNSEVNHMTSSNLAVCIALSILCLPSSCNSGFPDVSKKICLVSFLIENYPKIFGEDSPFHDESSFVCSDGEKSYNSLNTVTDNVEMEVKEHEDNTCPSGSTCPTGNDAVSRSPSAPLHNEGIIDSEEDVKTSFINPTITQDPDTSQDNMCLTPPEPNEEHPIENTHTPPAANEANLSNSDTPPAAKSKIVFGNTHTPPAPNKENLEISTPLAPIALTTPVKAFSQLQIFSVIIVILCCILHILYCYNKSHSIIDCLDFFMIPHSLWRMLTILFTKHLQLPYDFIKELKTTNCGCVMAMKKPQAYSKFISGALYNLLLEAPRKPDPLLKSALGSPPQTATWRKQKGPHTRKQA
ncbi:rho GTPase-activating protein 20 [Cricetulus griseus]|uniref:Rho GTPase-activating protein 20 n=1 Tax=Cricetulus griseus TaxID=10029 RepID=A0A9J7F942_CRIGR|nr:rho GTPase-activating protein 20 [Cricetulus griseus]